MNVGRLSVLVLPASAFAATIGLPAVAQAYDPPPPCRRGQAVAQYGLRTDNLPTVTVAADQPQYAVVEGVAVDRNDPDRLCPRYTELLVTAPDTTETFTVPVSIDTCELQVHPMGSEW